MGYSAFFVVVVEYAKLKMSVQALVTQTSVVQNQQRPA